MKNRYLIRLVGGQEYILPLDETDVKEVSYFNYHGSEMSHIELTKSGLEKLFSIPDMKDKVMSPHLISTVTELSTRYIDTLISIEESRIKACEQMISKLTMVSDLESGFIKL